MAADIIPDSPSIVRKKRWTRHGHCGSREYYSWRGAVHRSTNKTNPKNARYISLGVTMCDSWIHSFPTFLRDMGPRPPGTSLDRIDNNGPYSKENCRWATPVEQSNNRRNRVVLRIGEIERTSTEWSKISGIPEKTIWKRYNTLGWSAERSVFEAQRGKK
jgi:hypothetical protein